VREVIVESILDRAREMFSRIVREEALDAARVSVRAGALAPEEAIGSPARRDFPILAGREAVIEAVIDGSRGQAFTSEPASFEGTLGEILAMELRSDRERAFLLAAMNAVMAHLGMLEGTLHCKGELPERCAREMASRLCGEWGAVRVGLVGLNPAIAEALASEFGAGSVAVTDLDPATIGRTVAGVEVWDGRTRTGELVERSDGLVITGSCLANGTFDGIFEKVRAMGRLYVVFGITAASVCRLVGLERVCLYPGDGRATG
jgi:uncharacterized protein (DUF4213/DUF364 family)